jgi:hypothetical protein
MTAPYAVADAAIVQLNHLIPAKFGEQLRARARKSRQLKLQNLLELRDFIAENYDRIERDGWMRFYAEAADWTDCAAETMRHDLDTIRSYPDADLKRWILAGLSFDHLATANGLQEASHYEASYLLDFCINLGGENGKRMTVEEMTAFALGENTPRSKTFDYVRTLTGWILKLPNKLGWNTEKSAAFEARVRELIKEFFT